MNWALLAVSVISVGAFWVFCKIVFRSKTPGFGPYNTGTFLLLTTSVLTAILATVGMIDAHNTTSIMLTIIGFGGGLFAGKNTQTEAPPKEAVP